MNALLFEGNDKYAVKMNRGGQKKLPAAEFIALIELTDLTDICGIHRLV